MGLFATWMVAFLFISGSHLRNLLGNMPEGEGQLCSCAFSLAESSSLDFVRHSQGASVPDSAISVPD